MRSHRRSKRPLSRSSSTSGSVAEDDNSLIYTSDAGTVSKSVDRLDIDDDLKISLNATSKFSRPLDTVFTKAFREHVGARALLFACLSDDQKAVRAILSDKNQTWTVEPIRLLILTTRLGHFNALQSLLDVLSSKNIIDFDPPPPNLSLLEHAVMAQDWSLANVLLSIAKRNPRTNIQRILSARKASRDLLTLATINRDPYNSEQFMLITDLIDCGAGCDPEVVDPEEGYPLTNVAKAGSAFLVRLLLGKGADPRTKTMSDWKEYSPLQALSQKIANLEEMRSLIRPTDRRVRRRYR